MKLDKDMDNLPHTPKPKLLLVADTYYPKVDGTLRFIREFLKRSEKEFEVALLVPNLGAKKGQKATYLDVYRKITISGYPSIKLSLANLQHFKNAVQSTDLVFVQGPALAGFLGIRYGHKYGKKTLFYTHILPWELFAKFFPFPFNHLFYQLIKWISVHYYNLCDEVLVPYHALKEQLENEGVQAKVTVARLGVDIEKYCPSKDRWASKRKVGLEPEKMVIGYVGRVSKEKNVKALLEAFRKLPNQKDLFLLIVGDGPQEQVQNFKEVKNCLVTGFVYNVEDYLQAMDLFVLPSLTETTSLATLEAMSTGLPVIATKIGFIQNYIVKNYNGMFFPRNNPALLATKIELLIKNRELREKLGQNARKTVAYSFSWERSINKIKRILLEQHYQE